MFNAPKHRAANLRAFTLKFYRSVRLFLSSSERDTTICQFCVPAYRIPVALQPFTLINAPLHGLVINGGGDTSLSDYANRLNPAPMNHGALFRCARKLRDRRKYFGASVRYHRFTSSTIPLHPAAQSRCIQRVKPRIRKHLTVQRQNIPSQAPKDPSDRSSRIGGCRRKYLGYLIDIQRKGTFRLDFHASSFSGPEYAERFRFPLYHLGIAASL